MSETIKLDPSTIAVGRTELDITSYVAASGTGIDWGDAAIQAYTASVTVGEVRLHYRLPNRLINIPLILRNIGATTFLTIRQQLQSKVGLFQRENGWLGRTTDAGTLYADIQTATLHLGGSWLQAYRGADVDAVLALECLPDWYGDEIILSDHVETVLPHLFFTEATINGNHPGRVRIVMDNDGTADAHGLLWGFRSRYYNSSTTAALFYEAEQLLPLNNATRGALTSASGGTAVTQGSLPADTWTSILSTNMLAGTTPLTHAGSYRVWARCYSASATPQYQLVWGIGSLSVPVVNDPVQLPGTAQFYLLDLGEVRLDAAPVGVNQWFGAIQAQANNQGDPASVDCVWLQPLDDGAGRLAYVNTPPASSLQVVTGPATAADDSLSGTITWTNPTNTVALDTNYATAILTGGQTSHWLKATNYFAIPAGATIRGIGIVAFFQYTQPTTSNWGLQGRIVKAGTVQTSLVPAYGAYSAYGPDTIAIAGGPTDLWGSTWTASDINNSGFGAAVQFNNVASSSAMTFSVNYLQMQVWYVLATGFTVVSDAVIAAGKTIELRTDGMYRQGAGGTIYAPVSTVIGDLPRIPPSGLEARSVQVFLKSSRGEFNLEPDSGVSDDVSAKIVYRPSFLYTP